MFVGELSNYSANIFILTSYAIIFSLSAILANLISEKGRYNPILILFSLIFVELALLVHGYNQLRIIFGSFLFLIGLVIYNPEKNKLMARLLVYSAGFFHIALFVYLIAFEIYSLFLCRKDSLSKNAYYYLKVFLILIATIVFLNIMQPILLEFVEQNQITKNAYQLYLNPETAYPFSNKIFNYRQYFNLMYLMVITYVVLNFKQLKSYEVFCIMAHIALEIIMITNNVFNIVFTRASLVPHLLFILISCKALYSLDFFKGLSKWKSVYIFCFISLIFSIRIYKYNFNGLLFQLENVAQGAFLSPSYGLIYSLIHYRPVFL